MNVSAFTGPQGRGAQRERRATKRTEAETRNALTRPENRANSRRPCPTGKRRFVTEQYARAELVGTTMARNNGRAQRQECRAYLCPICKGWHLTSKPERKQ